MITIKSKNYYQINYINKYSLLDYTQDIVNNTNNRSIIIIPNLCNMNYTYGGFVSNRIAEYYPIVEQSYNVLGKVFIGQNPGYVQFIDVLKNKNNKLIVANMIAQTGAATKSLSRTIKYNYLVDSMNNIQKFIQQQKNLYTDEHVDISVHSYKFGIGKSCNGKWEFISNLIEDIWLNCSNIFIYNK